MKLINLKALFAVALFSTLAHSSQPAKQQRKTVHLDWSKEEMKTMLKHFKTDGAKKRQQNRAHATANNALHQNQIQKNK